MASSGRPRVGGKQARVTHTVAVRMSAQTYAALLQYARAIGALHDGQPAAGPAAREALVSFLARRAKWTNQLKEEGR